MVTQTIAQADVRTVAGKRLWAQSVDRYICAAVFFVMYAAMSLIQHRALGTGGFDIGIFDQAIRNYAHFHAPVVDIKGQGYIILGDHWAPALVVFAPLYWIYPNPATLLVAQAALVAISLLPVYRLALERLGRRGALAIGIAYGLSFGIQTAIAFDFHEVALAAPMFAFGLVALVEQRWRACAMWLFPLLLVREEMGVYLAVIGFVLFLRGQRKLGAWMAGIGLVCAFVIVKIVVPSFNSETGNPYLGYYSSFSPVHLFDNSLKLKMIFLVCAISGLLALRSPIMLVVPVDLVIRFYANNSFYWTPFAWAYSLILMPVIFVAYLDAYPRWTLSRRRAVRLYTRWSPAVVLVVALGLLTHLPLIPYLVKAPQHLALSAHAQAAYDLMAKIPNGTTVEATNHLAPHLTPRDDVVMWPFTQINPPWAIVDTTADDYQASTEPAHIADLQKKHGYVVVGYQEGILLLRAPNQH
jgi:uncharacterized membrane protein